jgi:hypothetical protein
MRLFKRHTVAAVAAAIVAFGGGTAEAAPIAWDETFNPPDVLFNSGSTTDCTGSVAADTVSNTTCRSLAFVYTLDGFDTATDALVSGSVTLFFYDDAAGSGDSTGQPEVVNIVFDGATPGTSLTITTGGALYASPALDVTAALSDGSLTVLLSRGSTNPNNDFYFASARLIADGTRTDAQEEDPPPTGGVPEPASLLLFGMAATAAALRSRRR